MSNPNGYSTDDYPAPSPMRQSGPLHNPSQPPAIAPALPPSQPPAFPPSQPLGTPGVGTPYQYPPYPPYPPYPSGPLPPQPPVYSVYPSVPGQSVQPVYIAPAAPVVIMTGVGMGPVTETCGWATASLICGIVGWVAVPVLGSLLAVIFGHVALAEIKRSTVAMDGHGLAVTGLVLGYIPLAGLAVLICLIAFAAASAPR